MHSPKLHIRIPAHAPGVVSKPSSLIISENTKGEQQLTSPLPAVLSLMPAQVPAIATVTTNDHSLKRQKDIDSFEDSDGDSVSETWKGNKRHQWGKG